MKKVMVNLINFYQIFLSFDSGILKILAPGGACKYKISCSQYTKIKIEQEGVAKGLSAGFNRILSCH